MTLDRPANCTTIVIEACCWRRGQIETAIDRLDEAYELDHENEEVMFKLAYLLDLRGSDERAIGIYEILADRRPVREGVLLNLSIILCARMRAATTMRKTAWIVFCRSNT